MRRLPVLGLLALLLLGAGCGASADPVVTGARAAGPQEATVSWVERYPEKGAALVFGVQRVRVTPQGWSADVSIRNETASAFALGDQPADLAFGVMLFADGDLKTLQAATVLPSIRRARTIAPLPPQRLEPGATWRATISAPGALADGSYLRVTFGALRALGKAPDELARPVVWITDHAYAL